MRYYSSRFLGNVYLDTLQTQLFDCCAMLGLHGLLQVSMDGPNVNFKAMQLLNSQIDGEVGHRLFDAGSCGMHTIHNAFRSTYATTGWDVEQSFTSLYWLFKDSPVRCEDYISVTGLEVFPQKFSQTCWAENVGVAERLLEMWPFVQQYFAVVHN